MQNEINLLYSEKLEWLLAQNPQKFVENDRRMILFQSFYTVSKNIILIQRIIIFNNIII